MAKIFRNTEKINEKEVEVDNKGMKVELSLKPGLEERMSDIHVDYLKEEVEELPQIEKGELRISGVYAFDNGDAIEVKFYILNGLSTVINFKRIPLYIIDNEGKHLARQIFDLSEIGEIPSFSARPWKVEFNKKSLLVDKIPMDNWQVAFDNRMKPHNYMDIEFEKLPEALSPKEVSTFNNYLKCMKGIEDGKLDISTYSIARYVDKSILITLIFRNSSDKITEIGQVPIMIVRNEDNLIVAKGTFKLDNFEINPYKARVLSLIFPKESVPKEEIDFNKCRVIFKDNN